MSQGILDLIQAIDSGDSQTIDNAFNAEMAARVSARLDDMRQDVAQNLFSEASCGKKKMKESDCEDDDEKEMKESTEITFTAEELEQLEAYMQTEEFADLDEESKNTLVAYLTK